MAKVKISKRDLSAIFKEQIIKHFEPLVERLERLEQRQAKERLEALEEDYCLPFDGLFWKPAQPDSREIQLIKQSQPFGGAFTVFH